MRSQPPFKDSFSCSSSFFSREYKGNAGFPDNRNYIQTRSLKTIRQSGFSSIRQTSQITTMPYKFNSLYPEPSFFRQEHSGPIARFSSVPVPHERTCHEHS